MAFRQPSFVVPEADAYIAGLPTAESPLMRRVREGCEAKGLPAVNAQTGALLATLAAAARAERILEVGCLHGYSALWLLQGAPRARLESIELDAGHAATARAHFDEAGAAARATVHEGAALDVLPRLEPLFDVVFLDAVKSEYPAYLEHATLLLRPGGILAADNVLWGGAIWDEHYVTDDLVGLRETTNTVLADPAWHGTLVPVGDGLLVAVRAP